LLANLLSVRSYIFLSPGRTWQTRKKEWHELFFSGGGRDNTLLSQGRTSGLGVLQKADGKIEGTSIFDPVLAELMYKAALREPNSHSSNPHHHPTPPART